MMVPGSFDTSNAAVDIGGSTLIESADVSITAY